MSNLIKSGFVAFSQNDKLVINANESRIIKAMNTETEEKFSNQISVEEELAEVLLQEAELEKTDFPDENLLVMDGVDAGQSENNLQQRADTLLQSAREEANTIISNAHDEAQQIRAAAYEEAQQMKTQAHDDGYQAGYHEAMECADKELKEKEMALEQKRQSIQQKLQDQEIQLVRETEHRMVDLLCQLIPSITGIVVENQKDVLLYMVNTAMQNLDDSKKFVIKVSGDDYENLVMRKDEIYGALNPAVHMEIFEDAKLSPMQCMIETENGIVDVSLDVQLDNLITALKLMIKE